MPTLRQAADEHLEARRHRPSTKNDYTNCIYNHLLPGLGAATTLQNFIWGENAEGRKNVQADRDFVWDCFCLMSVWEAACNLSIETKNVSEEHVPLAP